MWWLLLTGVSGAAAPTTIDLDLCRENRLDVAAPGYVEGRIVVPAGSTPLSARTAASSLALDKIPTGRLVLPKLAGVRYFVDGQPVDRARSPVELTAGTHELRARDDDRFVDVAVPVEVPAEGSASPSIAGRS